MSAMFPFPFEVNVPTHCPIPIGTDQEQEALKWGKSPLEAMRQAHRERAARMGMVVRPMRLDKPVAEETLVNQDFIEMKAAIPEWKAPILSPDILMVREFMRGYRIASKTIATATIQRAVAAAFDVTVSDIMSDRRFANIVLPRQVSIFLMREFTAKSFPEIGKLHGTPPLNHATVMHAIRKIKRLIEESVDFSLKIASIRSELKAGMGIGNV